MNARLKIIDNSEIRISLFIENISKRIQSHHVEGVAYVTRLKSTLNLSDCSSEHVGADLGHHVRTFLCTVKLN